MAQVRIDGPKCTGQGRCYSLAPGVFDADDEGYGVVIAQTVEPGTDLAEQAHTAVLNCPETAVVLEQP